MEHTFWLNAWENDRTGWRQSKPGLPLQTHWSSLALSPGATVLVPLCGDSTEMAWLLQQGYQVIGCDLSEIGLTRFLNDHDIAAQRTERDGFIELSAPGVRLLAGDFMELSNGLLGPVHGFYDRAATIALPADMRRRYADHLVNLIEPGAPGLLVGISYNQNEMNGPPFSVPDSDIEKLYSGPFEVVQLASSSGSDLAGRLKERGLTTLTETCYQLTRLPIGDHNESSRSV